MKRPLFLLALASLGTAFPASAKVVRVEVKNVAFSPARISVHVGDTVEWVNKDFVAHTATARDGKWDINLPVHGKGSTVMQKARHIDYYCRYHPTMKGEIEVMP